MDTETTSVIATPPQVLTVTADQLDRPSAARMDAGTSHPVRIRTKAQMAAYFADLDMVDPGLVYVPTWRPEEPDDLLLDRPGHSSGFAGVASKPW